MGNSRRVHHASAVAALLLLTACEDSPQRWRQSEIHDIALDAARDVMPDDTAAMRADAEAAQADSASMAARITNLEAQLAKGEAETDVLRSEIESLRHTYNTHTHGP